MLPAIEKAGITLTYDFENATINGDSPLLKTAFINLLDNARKASDKDSEITSYDAYRALLMSVNQGIEIQNDEDEMVCLDVDRDEEITAWDAYRILIYSIGLISEF